MNSSHVFKRTSYSPQSCDTFAVLPPGTLGGTVVFGKNSDRQSEEVQEVVYFPAKDHPQPSKVRCTYIEIEQVAHTNAVVLSKPAWIWGAEMGANEYNVCIGNEAIWTALMNQSDSDKKLIGMDLLRLGLERAKSALEAVHIIVDLLAKYGMGGNCSEVWLDFTYHNSFLIADPEDVWILECAGTVWAAEKVTKGVRNISNNLSIGTSIDLKSDGLEEFAKEKGLWNSGDGPFNFKNAMKLDDSDDCSRYVAGRKLLTKFSQNGKFSEKEMFAVLRDKPSGICMSSGTFVSTGSQVSVLRKPDSGMPSVHWFTATPDPARSIFKPFVFTKEVSFPEDVVSPIPDEVTPRLGGDKILDRRHRIYRLQEQFRIVHDRSGARVWNKLKELESKYVELAEHIVTHYQHEQEKASYIFKDAVAEEDELYSTPH